MIRLAEWVVECIILVMAEAELPACISIVLCDAVYRDEETKKLVLAGVFNAVGVKEFPYTHPRMQVLFTLTNGRGTFDISLSIEDASTGKVMYEATGPFVSDSPLRVCDVNTEVVDVPFLAPGKYWVVLRSGTQLLAQRPFWVTSLTNGGTSHDAIE